MNIADGRRRLSGPGGPPSTAIIFTSRPLLYQFIATASEAPSHTLGSAAAAAAAEDASDDVVWHYYSTILTNNNSAKTLLLQ